MQLAGKIKDLSEIYRSYTAEVLGKMIRVPGFSGKEKDRCEVIVKLCREAGFDEVYIDGLGSVVGRVGHGPKKLAFDAHIDTVEVGDRSQWKADPFGGNVTEDGLVYGLGSSDQLGGAACMIASGRILKELGYDGEFTIYYTFTVMEEDCDGLCWLYLIEEEGLKPDYIVSSEPTACRLFRGQRGRMEIEIQLKGISSHGSLPHNGVSAAYKAARAALAMEQLNEDLKPDQDNFLGKGSVVVSMMEVKGPFRMRRGCIWTDALPGERMRRLPSARWWTTSQKPWERRRIRYICPTMERRGTKEPTLHRSCISPHGRQRRTANWWYPPGMPLRSCTDRTWFLVPAYIPPMRWRSADAITSLPSSWGLGMWKPATSPMRQPG